MYNHDEFIESLYNQRINGLKRRQIKTLTADLVYVIDYYADLDPDLSYLDDTEYPEDKERLANYNATWSMIIVYCTLYHKGVIIGSDSLGGVEDDSGEAYLKQIAQENLDNIVHEYTEACKIYELQAEIDALKELGGI